MRPERKRLHRGALPGAASSAPGPRSQLQRLWQTKGDEGCLGRPFSSLGRSVPVCAVVWVGLCEPRFLPALSVFGSAHFPLKAPRILPVPGPHPTKKSPVVRSMCVLTPTEKSQGERTEGCDRGQGALFLSWRPTTPGSSARGPGGHGANSLPARGPAVPARLQLRTHISCFWSSRGPTWATATQGKGVPNRKRTSLRTH